ncbi:hypothetical protein [Acinetobacter junii]|uniref:hypothetical protein n=1 Tax=Acinetobacter junii TaxID=40215 RepID=UPI00057AE1AF|nr:hypothetical protein [Acinetobacter junii]MDA3509317.1 hypothetical protein [Acinetobacter junii]MDA3533616.1 hypothetical protein [Acinetobacter junii]
MNKIIIIFFALLIIFVGVVWKSNSDRAAREEALAKQTELHNKKMAQLEAEHQAQLKQEAQEKAIKEQQRIEYNNQVKNDAEKLEIEAKQLEKNKVIENTTSIEEKARRNLFDPEAAKFRNIQGNCGEINAKNKMGGYTGYRRFIYDPEFDTVSIEDENDGLYNPRMMDILWEKKCP